MRQKDYKYIWREGHTEGIPRKAMSLIKPLIARIGGKSRLVSRLVELLPQHRLYSEIFAGGAGLFFTKEPSTIEILNDKDDMLVNFYKVVQNDIKRQELIKALNELPYSRNVFNYFRRVEPQDEIEKGVQFFYLSKASFAGDSLKGGFGCPSRSTTRNPAQTYQNSIDVLEHVARRLKGVTIECLPYQECIRRYDSPETLFYCDPPYMDTEHYYGNTFTLQDHYTLAGLLHDIKGKAMVTHYQNGLYDELYKGWNRYEYQSFKGSHKSTGEEKPKTVEVLYCNFEPVKTRGLFDAME